MGFICVVADHIIIMILILWVEYCMRERTSINYYKLMHVCRRMQAVIHTPTLWANTLLQVQKECWDLSETRNIEKLCSK